jgi:hypothetical protein
MMNGSITFYPTRADQPHGRVSGPGHGHLFLNRYDEPTLLLDFGDQAYLRALARAALDLAEAMDQAGDPR